MQSKIDQLIGKDFILSKVRYVVKTAKIVTGSFVIVTDKKSWNLYPSEFDGWIESIEIVDHIDKKEIEVQNLYDKTIGKVEANALPMEVVPVVLPAEIISSNEMTAKVSDKLFEMFEALSDNPTESCFKKAKAMVDISNAIVNAQMAQFRFLTLKK